MTEYYMYKTKDIIAANPHIPIKPVIDADIEIRIPVKNTLTENDINLPFWKRED